MLLLPNLNHKYLERDFLGDHLVIGGDKNVRDHDKAAEAARAAEEDMLTLAPLKRPTSPKIDALMDELNQMIGLKRVKKSIAELKDLVEFDFWRKVWFGRDMTLLGQSFHMAFLGNPGTGKTVIARIIGELLIEMGVIESMGRATAGSPYTARHVLFHVPPEALLFLETRGPSLLPFPSLLIPP